MSKQRVYFIDLDGVLVTQGTREFLPNALTSLQELSKKGDIWFFSCWAFTEDDVRWLQSLPVNMKGYIHKPLADEYVYIDDKLLVQECKTSL